MAAIPLIQLNPDATLRREQIADGAFCIIVDDFLLEPEVLVEYAARHPNEFSNPNIGYPGRQLRVNDNAMREILRFVRSKMSKQFAFMRGRIGIRSLLSLLTLPPEKLTSMQRICHVDPNPDPGREKYAALIYLFNDERLGGTSFFRWKDETLVWKAVEMLRADPASGEEFVKQQFETFREPPRYMTESNEIAERLFTVPPQFNRFVFYSGAMPHTGAITAPELLTDDARTGRLTLNLFFSVLPKGNQSTEI
jgi:hypothetical protein